jgi:UDP-N-acetylmuramoyl-tripeptide--D-alanyl-D-alanine ligase
VALTLADVAAATGGTLAGGDPAARVARVVTDSRQAGPGDLFVAIEGLRADGHDHAGQAAAAGAAAVLASRPVGAPHVLVDNTVAALGRLAAHHLAALRQAGAAAASRGRPLVIGVTGSVGKTTTKDLLQRLFASRGPTVAAAGSFNNAIGLPLTVLAAGEATEYLVLEYGANHVGEIAALAAIAPPDIAVELGVGVAHLGEFGSAAAIARAKAELLAGLRPGGTAVLNAGDPATMAMPRAGRTLTFGRAPDADVKTVQADDDGTGRLTVAVASAGVAAQIPTRLVGRHNAVNVAAAVAAGLAAGFDLAEAAAALAGAAPASPHRMALARAAGGALVLDDSYNANPDSMAEALATLARLAAATGRAPWAVLGEMLELGDAAGTEHRGIGRRAAELGIARLIAVGPGAREIAEGARAAGLAEDKLSELAGPAEATRWLQPRLTADAVILVKGSHGAQLWRVADGLQAQEG